MSKSKIFEYVREEKVTLWAGAGLSKYAGYPLASELKEIIFNRLTEDEKILIDRNLSLDLLSEEFVRIKYDDKTILHEILSETYCKAPESTEIHDLLVRIPHIKDIITTNYDPLFEITYAGRSKIIIHDQDVPLLSTTEVNIIKIHGDLSYPETTVITKSDYAKFYKLDTSSPFWSLIINKISTNVLVFIGYGYEDPNIWAICDHVSSYLLSSRKDAYLIAPDFPAHKVEFLKRKGITYLDMEAGVFFKELYENITDNILPDFRKGKVSPETLRQFLNQHNINPGLTGGEVGYAIDSLNSLNGQLKVDFTFTLMQNADLEESLRSVFENGITDPLVLDEDSIADGRLRIEGLNVFEDDEIAKIVVRKKPSAIIDFDLTFPEIGFELNDLKAHLYNGSKKFTIMVNIHNYTLTFNGSKISDATADIKFNLQNNLTHSNIKSGLEAYTFAKYLFSAEIFIVHIKGGGTFRNSLPTQERKYVTIAEGYIKYLEHLKKIEARFAIRFKNFSIKSPEEELIMRRLVRIIEEKPVILENNDVTMTMTKIYAKTIDMLEKMEYENHDIDINFNLCHVIELHGYKFTVNMTAVKVICAKATNLDEVRHRKTKEIKIISKTGKIYEYFNTKNAVAEKIIATS